MGGEDGLDCSIELIRSKSALVNSCSFLFPVSSFCLFPRSSLLSRNSQPLL